MNIVNKVTLRHLKENKRRTLVTILGVIISVAMITAVAALGISIIDMQQRDAIAHNGDWHYSLHHLDQEQLEAVQTEENTDRAGVMKEYGYASLDDPLLKNYLYVNAMDETAMEQMQVELTGGRLPENEDEVVLSEELIKQGSSYQLGETINLNIGERYYVAEEEGDDFLLGQNDSLQIDEDGIVNEELRNQTEHSFTIVGTIKEPVWDEPWSPGYTLLSYVDSASLTEIDRTFVNVKKLKNSIFDDVSQLRTELGIDAENSDLNTALLDTHLISLNSGMVAALTGLITVIMIIVMVGAVALIYNAFAISVSERSRYLGMLASVGATKRQKRNSVLFEGLVIAIISIPIGIGAGLLGIGITLYYINDMLANTGLNSDIRLVVTLPIFIIAIVVSLLTIMISAWIPAVRASRITAIDAIRQAKDVKLSRKKVKTNRFVQKLFGYEAEIALKNLKRNKKRYQVTVFSLMVSIILFLSVGFFTSTLAKSFELQSDAPTYDISVSGRAAGDELDAVYAQVENMEQVKNLIRYDSIRFTAYIPEDIAGDTMEGMEEYYNGETIEGGGVEYTIRLIGFPTKDWENYLAQNDISLPASEKQQAVFANTVSYMDYDGKYIETEMLNVEEGDMLPLHIGRQNEVSDDLEIQDIGELELIGFTENFPMGGFYPFADSLLIFVEEDTFESVIEDVPYSSENRDSELFLTADDPYQVEEDMEAIVGEKLNMTNVYAYQQQDKQLVFALSIFIYGFITLITLISIANIFNTISTGVALRKREFATMKSIGMTPKAFRKMIRFESLFYGMKALLYGLPISVLVMYIIHLQTRHAFEFNFELPWIYIGIVIVAVFFIVGAAMLYSISKLKNDNIVETLRQENI